MVGSLGLQGQTMGWAAGCVAVPLAGRPSAPRGSDRHGDATAGHFTSPGSDYNSAREAVSTATREAAGASRPVLPRG